jgi:hypothetical protein
MRHISWPDASRCCCTLQAEPHPLDPVIDSLRSLDKTQLPEAIAQNVKIIAKPTFFLRIAERADHCKNSAERYAPVFFLAAVQRKQCAVITKHGHIRLLHCGVLHQQLRDVFFTT